LAKSGNSILGGLAVRGELREEDGREKEKTAKKLAGGVPLVEEEGAGEKREDGLEAHQKRRDRRLRPALGDDLEGVGNRAGADARVKKGYRGRTEGGERREAFGEEDDGKGQDAHDGELERGEEERVERGGEAVHDENVEGEGARAEEEQSVAGKERAEAVRQAEKGHSRGAEEGAEEVEGAEAAAGEEAEKGNQEDVEGGEEARLARVGGGHGRLLEGAAEEEAEAAEKAGEEMYADGRDGAAGTRAKEENDRGEHEGAQEKAQAVEGERGKGFGPGALGDEGRAPDGGGGEKEEISACGRFHGRGKMAKAPRADKGKGGIPRGECGIAGARGNK